MNRSFRLYYSSLLLCALLLAGASSVDAFVGVGTIPPTSLTAPSFAAAARRTRLAADVASSEGDAETTTTPTATTTPTTPSTRTAEAGSTSSSSTPPQPQRQALYGSALEYPDSYVRCGKCEAIYALHEDDLGRGRGRRLECAICQHSWFQSKDRLMTVKQGEYEMVPMPQRDLTRIQQNIVEGRAPKFVGNKKLYVGNVAFECHEDDLFEIFGKAGEVGDVSLVRDEEGKNRGFGFVTMRTDEGGDKAIAELDGLAVRGRNIAVRESNS